MKARLLVIAMVVFGSGLSALRAAALPQHSGHGGHTAPVTSQPSARTGKVSGKIVEMDASSVTVETSEKGKTKRVICLVDSQTKVKGIPAPGEEVVVKYSEVDGQMTATSMEVKKKKK